MGKENTSVRLKQLMKERHLRQVDILAKCKPFCEKYDIKLGRNDLSQYVNGKVEPGQEKLTVLGMALNVSEAWLMGYNVPIARNGQCSIKEEASELLKYFGKLNALGKKAAAEQVRLLTLDEKYTRPDEIISIVKELDTDYLEPDAAHERTGAEIKEDDRLEDEKMID